MYTAYVADTPNGRKLIIALEEFGLDYRVRHVDLGAGEQFAPEFLQISPNNKIPALVDERTGQGLFESCAILVHLGRATGKLLPDDDIVLPWLFLQAASVGPMLGQLWWFRHAAPERNQMALDRYTRETQRLYGVIERRLAVSTHVAGDEYTVADIAFYPWLATYDELGIDMTGYPHVAAWLRRIAGRPAVERARIKMRKA
ncbi:glutathione binding-like protein [Telluria mixta]|uniref:Glutathione binding-like protein n=1 Tax=Telluria mixta TaxID=34071 RepID=A0ABT2BT91_9BURK|nr:glutathione binding-like protein [Telluria mixta]MCS0628345.1 glutathione binding-like protein [Telluria mixta]WEM93547.1 glutathione binding-like protein [Telluria mixta]